MKNHVVKHWVLGIAAVALVCAAAGGVAWAADTKAAEAKPAEAKGDPFPLDTCPVSGKKLGDAAIAKQIDNREVKFCCDGCPAKFEADKATFMKKVDEAIIAKEKPMYVAKACPVSGKEIAADAGVDKVIGNRLVRFCCDGCPAAYQKDTAKYSAKLDEQIIMAQKDKYPLTTCVVSGEKLGEMGKPVDFVVENRLVKLCCASCKKDLLKNPDKYLSQIDAAAKGAKPADKPAEKKG